MKEDIDKLLSQKAPLKARDIARELGFTRNEVSSFLDSHPEHYEQDQDSRRQLHHQGNPFGTARDPAV
jgi:predicted ArsR family transcriptional regulator